MADNDIRNNFSYVTLFLIVIIILCCLLVVQVYYEVGSFTNEYKLGYKDAINGNSTTYEILGGDNITDNNQAHSYYWYKNGYRVGVNDIRLNETSAILKNRVEVTD